MTSTILVFITLAGCSLFAVALFALHKSIRGGAAQNPRIQPISVLKPLCGADDQLESNLRSFFEQDYPAFQLIFGVEGSSDPAIKLVNKLAAEYASVPSKLVIHDGKKGINPKVANLRAMLDSVDHEVVLISDSNVQAPSSYLRETVAVLGRERVGLVSNLFVGSDEDSLGATMDNLHLNGHIAAGVGLSHHLPGPTLVVGKSMMFRRSEFESLGGFESVASVLAEDYIIGRMYQTAGYKVVLAPTILKNINRSLTVGGFWRRHLRWAMLRTRLNPGLYLLEPLTSPLVWGVLAALAGAPVNLALFMGIFLCIARDAMFTGYLRGTAGLARCLPYSPLKDGLVLAIWLTAPFKRHIAWRGHRVRISSGTRLFSEAPRYAQEPVVVNEVQLASGI
ncbi:MAG: hypothetical protein AUK47_10920 [Deltaproteobacteria bacterium CG2_30_63_29]|nr:MAG: hypothetical protein AUK47_10920 [Deltaproteobacteria bacterium CG2_30_63_29]PIV98152.1 MAG: ceramide glucosyltransferase [Deltaproteobacteria bacterium CG17_big_fil_post_rev_8_21_14_2_50_63_7]PJB34564.1 MAG: ceramide glucosyltransferase [Deltaproteobacteria bacterium CG_4_9_14_3_um_filter_63_12]